MSRRRPRPIAVANPRPGGVLATARRWVLFVAWMSLLSAGAAGGAAYLHFAKDLPPLPSVDKLAFEGVSDVLADDGQLGEDLRVPVQ